MSARWRKKPVVIENSPLTPLMIQQDSTVYCIAWNDERRPGRLLPLQARHLRGHSIHAWIARATYEPEHSDGSGCA